MASLLRQKALLAEEPKSSKDIRRHGDGYHPNVAASRSREADRTGDVNKLMGESLGAKFYAQICVCGCGCNENVHFKFLTDKSMGYISKEPRNDEITIAALRMIHQRSMCPSCYHQHSWGKPLTDMFVQHMKVIFRSLDWWDRPPPLSQSQPNQALGVVVDGEPPRFHSLTYEGYRKLLGIPETDQMYKKCLGKRLDGSGCDAIVKESSIILNVYELHMTILTGATVVDRHLHDIYHSILCSSCSSDANARSRITEIVRQSTRRLTNPAWLQFHAQDQQSHQANKTQQNGSGSSADVEQKSQNYQMLAELRQRLLQSEDPQFITSFFELAEEMRSSLGRAGGGPGAPDEDPHGGGAGAS